LSHVTYFHAQYLWLLPAGAQEGTCGTGKSNVCHVRNMIALIPCNQWPDVHVC
jgi:hypothetical protein